MLFTRCPECETTFRVTDETLKRANGQVRCGRCASVFNAYAELRDPNAKSFDQPEPATPDASTLSSPLPPPNDATTPAANAPQPPAVSQPPTEPTPTAGDAIAMTVGERSVADVVAEVEQAAAATTDALDERETPSSAAPPSGADADAPISAKEVDAVLTAPVVVEAPSMGWPPFGAAPASGPAHRSRAWGAAAALALLALGTQVVHHYRTDIAGDPTFGPWLQRAYALLGAEVRPRWDVHQYEILDSKADLNARGVGSLKITAHIHNRGPLRQPYPAVRLKLKDRWEEAVGSRLFSPTEYLPSDTPRGRLMSPGETTRAEIEVIDPGPDAYGFELDVCIEVEASLVSCGTDEVFL